MYQIDSQVLTTGIGTFKNARQRVNCGVIMSFQGTAHASCCLSRPLSKSRTHSSRFLRRPRLRTPFTKTHLVRRSWLHHVHCMCVSTYCWLIRKVVICSQLCWHNMSDWHERCPRPHSLKFPNIMTVACHGLVKMVNSRYPRYAIWPRAGACHANHACAALTVSRCVD